MAKSKSGPFGCLVFALVIILSPFLILGGNYILDDVQASNSKSNRSITFVANEVNLPEANWEYWSGDGQAPQGYEIGWTNPKPSTSAMYVYRDAEDLEGLESRIEKAKYVPLWAPEPGTLYRYGKKLENEIVACIGATDTEVTISVEPDCDDGKIK